MLRFVLKKGNTGKFIDDNQRQPVNAIFWYRLCIKPEYMNCNISNIALYSNDQVFSETITMILGKRFSHIEQFCSGKLLQLVHNNQIDLLLVDADSLTAEDLRSLQFLRRLRCQLLILTFYGIEQHGKIKQELYSLADVLVRKPFDNQLLLSMIDHAAPNQKN